MYPHRRAWCAGKPRGMSYWWLGGRGFDLRRNRQHSFVERSRTIFSGHSLPSADSRRAVSFWHKNVHKFWLPRNGQVNWPAQHDLNSVDWAVKLQTKQQQMCNFTLAFVVSAWQYHLFGAQYFLLDCMCAQQRIRSACASAQSDQSLRMTLYPKEIVYITHSVLSA